MAGSWVYTERNQDENYQYRLTYIFSINITVEVKLFEIHNEEISKNSSKFTLIADENQVTISMNSKDNGFASNTNGYIISDNELIFSNDFTSILDNNFY